MQLFSSNLSKKSGGFVFLGNANAETEKDCLDNKLETERVTKIDDVCYYFYFFFQYFAFSLLLSLP